MLEKDGYIWKSNADVVCIPTHDNINYITGDLIMDIASQAKEFDSDVAYFFARHVEAHGNTPCLFHRGINPNFCSLPIKFNPYDTPELDLIERSIKLIVKIMDKDKKNLLKIALPRPGCGINELDWETQVRPLIEPLLDDRFIIYNF
ncbi:hypothetical protein KAU33_09150 [Candidatus Dependentiae bacterium]|nr:hypothetical protein [Candidatus Dependentiae bacterium]